jgi:hypothetical protein
VVEAASIEAGEGFVRVVFAGTIDSVAAALALQERIEAAAKATRRVLLDYRSVGAHADEVRESMWDWAARADLQSIAVVVDGEMTRVRLNMTALSRRVPMRAFLGPDEAAQWLVDPNPRRATRITRLV